MTLFEPNRAGAVFDHGARLAGRAARRRDGAAQRAALN
jgi:hypothetical protein